MSQCVGLDEKGDQTLDAVCGASMPTSYLSGSPLSRYLTASPSRKRLVSTIPRLVSVRYRGTYLTLPKVPHLQSFQFIVKYEPYTLVILTVTVSRLRLPVMAAEFLYSRQDASCLMAYSNCTASRIVHVTVRTRLRDKAEINHKKQVFIFDLD